MNLLGINLKNQRATLIKQQFSVMIQLFLPVVKPKKKGFYSSWGSIELPFDDDDHHVFINCKYYSTNKFIALQMKQNYFGIIHLKIILLNKYIYSPSNVINLMNFNFPVIVK